MLHVRARATKLDGTSGNKNTSRGIADWGQSARSIPDGGSKIPEKFWLRAGPRTTRPQRSRLLGLRLPQPPVARAAALGTGQTAVAGTPFPGRSLDTADWHANAASKWPPPDTPDCNSEPADTTDGTAVRIPLANTNAVEANTGNRLALGLNGSHAERGSREVLTPESLSLPAKFLLGWETLYALAVTPPAPEAHCSSILDCPLRRKTSRLSNGTT